MVVQPINLQRLCEAITSIWTKISALARSTKQHFYKSNFFFMVSLAKKSSATKPAARKNKTCVYSSNTLKWARTNWACGAVVAFLFLSSAPMWRLSKCSNDPNYVVLKQKLFHDKTDALCKDPHCPVSQICSNCLPSTSTTCAHLQLTGYICTWKKTTTKKLNLGVAIFWPMSPWA